MKRFLFFRILQLSAEHFTPQYSHYTMLFGCRNCFLFRFRTFYNARTFPVPVHHRLQHFFLFSEENSLSVSGMSARKQQFLVAALDRGFLRQGFRVSIIFPVVNSPQITIPFFRFVNVKKEHMRIGKVIGNIWATRKEEKLAGLKLLIVQPINAPGEFQGHE